MLLKQIRKNGKSLILPLLSGLLVAGVVRAAEMFYDFDAQEYVVNEAQRFIGTLDITGNTTLTGDFTANSNFHINATSGRVGIGTVSPSQLLDVSGGTGIVGRFSGRVIGGDAVNADEFATLGQVTSEIGSATHDPVTLSGQNYLSITNQVITANPINLSGSNITDILAISNGGTGASTASGARTNLGATTVGANIFTLANPSAVSFLRVNANNTVSALNASDFRAAIGAGTLNNITGLVTAGTNISISGSGTSASPYEISTNIGSGTGGDPLLDYFKQSGNAFGDTATLGTTDDHSLRIITNSIARMSIGTDGNVGIGVESPQTRLDISDGVATPSGSPTFPLRVTGAAGGLSNPGFIFERTDADKFISMFTGSNGPVLGFESDAARLAIGTYDYSDRYSTGYPTNEIMSLLPSGNVGIGTTNPTERLHVIGNGLLSNNLSVGGRIEATDGYGFFDTRSVNGIPSSFPGKAMSLDFKSRTSVGNPPTSASASNTYAHIMTIAGWSTHEGSGGWPTQVSFGGGGIGLRQASNENTWGPWSSTVMANAAGNVGIGTTSPSYLLDVSGGSGIVGRFSGRVRGGDAVNNDELATLGQVKSLIPFSNRKPEEGWILQSVAPSGYWNVITYGNNLFVMTSYSGTGYPNQFATSSDGITWTGRGPTMSQYYGLTHGGSYFVAVGTNKTLVSTNGTSWNSRTITSGNWRGVAYGNNLYVAVRTQGGNSSVATSTNPNTNNSWTLRTTPVVNNLRTVTYGNGTFVAMGVGEIITSTNGTTWTQRSSPIANIMWESVTYGNNRFVAVARDYVAYSTNNGVSWSSVNLPGNWRGISYGDGEFVAVGFSGSASSTDGINWTLNNSAPTAAGIAFGKGIFVAATNAIGTEGAAITQPSFIYSDKGMRINGSVLAQAFINTSTFDSKEDITPFNHGLDSGKLTVLDEGNEEESEVHTKEGGQPISALDKILRTDIVTYRYKFNRTEQPYLGLIADRPGEYYVPEEVLGYNEVGKIAGIDLYKLSAFTLAGIQELNLKVDTLSLVGGETTDASLVGIIKNALRSVGIEIKNGIIKLAGIIADSLTVGSKSTPGGITIYDEEGNPHCLRVNTDGSTFTSVGKCKDLESQFGSEEKDGNETLAPIEEPENPGNHPEEDPDQPKGGEDEERGKDGEGPEEPDEPEQEKEDEMGDGDIKEGTDHPGQDTDEGGGDVEEG